MRRSGRCAGRHRVGAPLQRVFRRLWDPRQREEAARLNAREPGWEVLYGPWTRRFWGFAAWPSPRGVIVHAPTADELVDAMRAAEVTAAVNAAPTWWDPSP